MSTIPTHYGDSARGVKQKDVSYAADELLRAGERPTVERVRLKIGSGSPNTVGPLLDQWWKVLAARLVNGPAAFHRLPESVSHIAEALWLQALDEARTRVQIEQSRDKRLVEQDKEHSEIRSHVLTLREAEMDSRLKEKDKLLADMDARLSLLTTALRREQTGRNELIRKLSALEYKPSPAPNGKRRSHKKSKQLRQTKRVKRKPKSAHGKAKSRRLLSRTR